MSNREIAEFKQRLKQAGDIIAPDAKPQAPSDRPLATSAMETLGKVLTDDHPRDAVHIAVFTAIVDQKLSPGTHVGLRNGVASPIFHPHIGIVDPFLSKDVNEGDRVWICLFPGMVGEVRHTWNFPLVDNYLEKK